MKKKIINIVISIFMMVTTIFPFAGCGNKYNAEIITSGMSFQQQFLDNSITYGAYYQKEYFNSQHSQWEKEWVLDEISPQNRTYIIRDRISLSEIFSTFPEIDFGEKMVLVYCYTSCYDRKQVLKSISLNDEKCLNINFTMKNGKIGYGDASLPQRRILVIKMDALDIISVDFQFLK